MQHYQCSSLRYVGCGKQHRAGLRSVLCLFRKVGGSRTSTGMVCSNGTASCSTCILIKISRHPSQSALYYDSSGTRYPRLFSATPNGTLVTRFISFVPLSLSHGRHAIASSTRKTCAADPRGADVYPEHPMLWAELQGLSLHTSSSSIIFSIIPLNYSASTRCYLLSSFLRLSSAPA